MKKLILIFLLLLVALAASARQFAFSAVDARRTTHQLGWFQGEDVTFTISDSTVSNCDAVIWDVVSATNLQHVYIVATATVSDVTASFWLSPSNANLSAGQYIGFVRAVTGTVISNQTIIARQRIAILPATDSRITSYVGPLTYAADAQLADRISILEQAMPGYATVASLLAATDRITALEGTSVSGLTSADGSVVITWSNNVADLRVVGTGEDPGIGITGVSIAEGATTGALTNEAGHVSLTVATGSRGGIVNTVIVQNTATTWDAATGTLFLNTNDVPVAGGGGSATTLNYSTPLTLLSDGTTNVILPGAVVEYQFTLTNDVNYLELSSFTNANAACVILWINPLTSSNLTISGAGSLSVTGWPERVYLRGGHVSGITLTKPPGSDVFSCEEFH